MAIGSAGVRAAKAIVGFLLAAMTPLLLTGCKEDETLPECKIVRRGAFIDICGLGTFRARSIESAKIDAFDLTIQSAGWPSPQVLPIYVSGHKPPDEKMVARIAELSQE